MALLRKRKKKTDEETTQVAPEADAAAERSPYASTEGTDGGLGEEPNTATPGSNAGSEQALADLAGLDAPDDESGGDSESEAAPNDEGDEGDEDDLISIFKSEEVEDSDLAALTGNLEDVEMDSVLTQSREVLDLLRNRAEAP